MPDNDQNTKLSISTWAEAEVVRSEENKEEK